MAAAPVFDWFSSVDDDSIQQGDFFFECPAVVSTTEQADGAELILKGVVADYDVIVISQSCDLEHQKLKHALVCAHFPLRVVAESAPRFKDHNQLEAVRQGNAPGFHMLNKCTLAGFESEIRIVNFKELFSIPMDYLRQRAHERPRLRLLPPYREQLAQAFARYFMRVGLPVDIPPFKK